MAVSQKTRLIAVYERVRTSAFVETAGRWIVAIWVAHAAHESSFSMPVGLFVLIVLYVWALKPLLNQYYQNTEVDDGA